jgi:peptidoglycan/xylan/chitin deacetylase (PgdA/CDA1 family)
MRAPLRRDEPLILAYHSVSARRGDALAVRLDAFAQQMAWLERSGYRSATLADFVSGAARGREPLVVITFDDGYADNFTLAVPVLERHGFVATFFAVTDYVGTQRIFPWDEPKLASLPDPSPFRVLDWDQLRSMHERGFEIGSHPCSHPHELTALSADERWDELVRSKRDLEAKLGAPVVSFCYPRGSVDVEVMQAVEEAGYECGVVTPTRWGLPLTPFTLRRVGIYQQNSPFVFRLKTSRFMRRNQERRHWLRGRRL